MTHSCTDPLGCAGAMDRRVKVGAAAPEVFSPDGAPPPSTVMSVAQPPPAVMSVAQPPSAMKAPPGAVWNGDPDLDPPPDAAIAIDAWEQRMTALADRIRALQAQIDASWDSGWLELDSLRARFGRRIGGDAIAAARRVHDRRFRECGTATPGCDDDRPLVRIGQGTSRIDLRPSDLR